MRWRNWSSRSDALLSLRRTGHRGHGIPNLERKISESPRLFVQALALVFKRKDDGQDPPEWRVDDPDHRASLQHAAFRLLGEISRVPGTDDDGRVDLHALSQWVTEARRLCRENGRATIGDQQVGQLLSRAPSEKDGPWPCREVCDVLETIASEDIAAGFEMGVYNARGVHSRSLGEGGKQERELSARYQGWAEQLTTHGAARGFPVPGRSASVATCGLSVRSAWAGEPRSLASRADWPEGHAPAP